MNHNEREENGGGTVGEGKKDGEREAEKKSDNDLNRERRGERGHEGEW